MIRLYTRVLELLGKERRLGWILAGANLLLAGAQFAEPVLFGRIIDVLSGNLSTAAMQTDSASPWPLLAAWVAFGLFTIVCGAVVALHADRLAHRQRQAVLTDYFEHIMQLPLTFHTGTHSGRLMKVMLAGTDALWRVWLGFFREHFASIVSLFVLLPLSIYLNWRLAILLVILCVVFTVLTTMVVRKTSGMQSDVEEHYGDLSARASDALGNVALVQSFTRIDAEVQGLRGVSSQLLEKQMPVLSWWALVSVMTRASTTITVLAIFTVGIALHQQGSHHRRRDRDVRQFCDDADPEARTGGLLHQHHLHGSAAVARFHECARCRACRARPYRRHGSRPVAGHGRIQRRVVLL
jgi:ABC-type multidrug transport system fused ATPase/permease subunit